MCAIIFTPTHCPLYRRPKSTPAQASNWTVPRWPTGSAKARACCVLWWMPSVRMCWPRSVFTPTISQCRCWTPAVAAQRPVGCGVMCATTARLPAQRLRRCVLSQPGSQRRASAQPPRGVPRHPASSPGYRRNWEYCVFFRHFGMKTTWYLRPRLLWFRLSCSSIDGTPCACAWAAHAPELHRWIARAYPRKRQAPTAFLAEPGELPLY